MASLDSKGLTLLWNKIRSYINGRLEAISLPDIIPVSDGGTGADNAEEALQNLGGMSMELLWENASPTSAFAYQTIALDLSEYDMVEIEYKLTAGGANWKRSRSRVGGTGMCDMVMSNAGFYNGSNPFVAFRAFDAYADRVNIGIGYTHVSQDDKYIIPTRIYGIKGVQQHENS